MELKILGLTKQYGSKTAVDHLNITLSNGVVWLAWCKWCGQNYIYASAMRYSDPDHLGKVHA